MIFIVFPHTDNNSGLFWISFSEARVYGLLFFCRSLAMSEKIRINSPNVHYTEKLIESRYSYQSSSVTRNGGIYTVSLSQGVNLMFCLLGYLLI